jgi:dihydrofolate reductase
MFISLVVAMDRSGLIGNRGSLPWCPREVPGEWALFRLMTQGRPVIMGRKTWESLPHRPLKGRYNIVLTRSWPGPEGPNSSLGCDLVHSWDAALDAACACNRGGEAFVIGGAQVYELAYPIADIIYLTLVDGTHEGDVHFPFRVLDDPAWIWTPDPVKGTEWERHILCRRLNSREQE